MYAQNFIFSSYTFIYIKFCAYTCSHFRLFALILLLFAVFGSFLALFWLFFVLFLALLLHAEKHCKNRHFQPVFAVFFGPFLLHFWHLFACPKSDRKMSHFCCFFSVFSTIFASFFAHFSLANRHFSALYARRAKRGEPGRFFAHGHKKTAHFGTFQAKMGGF